MIGDDLYKRGYDQPLLKCVMAEQAQYIIKELHEGVCCYHSGARTIATMVLRVGYFWPTIEADCQDYVRKCKPCKKHGNLIHQKQEQLHHIISPWPFTKWGMDILGPFSPGKGQVKFLIVTVDYSTKWMASSPPIGTAHTVYAKTQEEELIAWNTYPGKRFPTLGMYRTSNSTLAECIL